MKKLLLKAGYLVLVTTWEHDGHNYKTEEVSGLNKNQVEIIAAISTLFKSHHPSDISNVYGDGSGRKDFLQELIRVSEVLVAKMVELGLQCSLEDPQFLDDPFIYANDIFKSAIGVDLNELGLAGDDYLTRVCSSIDVSYIEEDVYADDVTAVFWS